MTCTLEDTTGCQCTCKDMKNLANHNNRRCVELSHWVVNALAKIWKI